MHDKAIPQPDQGCDPPAPDSEDALTQRAVLCLALDAYPESLTILHLAREINRGDATERHSRPGRAWPPRMQRDQHHADAGNRLFRTIGAALSIDIAARFGDNLKRQRRLADLSQDETAVRASLHRTEISYLERGVRLARVDTVAKLAGALEIEPGELFEGIRWKPGNLRLGTFLIRKRILEEAACFLTHPE